jgi:hypothetical protein
MESKELCELFFLGFYVKHAVCDFSFQEFNAVRTVHVLALQLHIITPTRAQVTNKRILLKDISYSPTCFGAVRHHHQG